MNLAAVSEKLDIFFLCYDHLIYVYELFEAINYQMQSEEMHHQGVLEPHLKILTKEKQSLADQGHLEGPYLLPSINAIKIGKLGDHEILVAVDDEGCVIFW